MKFVILAILCTTSTYLYPQGASCTNPHVLALDSVSRNFTISPTSQTSAECSAGFNGNGKITIFSFTTNASGSCVLIHIATSAPVQIAEVAMYAGCGSTGTPQGLQSGSSVCFIDGTGYWAPKETLTLLPNTTYYLRVWTPAAGTITMSATNYPPPNTLCSGASWISENARNDNNACAKASTEVTPIQLCAATLENTEFYTYIVESNGVSSIQLNDINCDNLNSADETGFQIGFFVGSCGSLSKISCATGSGGSLTATTGWLSAGTKVTVAIDGTAGSNCSYKITAFNAIVLPIILKYFTAWKRPDTNRITWLTTSENNFSHFEIEKSPDGVNFVKITSIEGKGGNSKETSYTFDDNEFKAVQYYRLRYVDVNGQSMYSNILRVYREDVINAKVLFSNRVTTMLALRLIDMNTDNLSIRIIDNSGREIRRQNVKINAGENSLNINTGAIPAGFYYLILSANNYKKAFSFVKS